MLEEHREIFDWLVFVDADELLVIKDGQMSLKEFLSRFEEFNGVALNGRFFGSSGKVEDGDYSMRSRFTRCSKILWPQVKIAVHCSKAPKTSHFKNVHIFVDNNEICPLICNVTKKHCLSKPEINDQDLEECLNIAWLAHYKTKTYDEFIKRMEDRIRLSAC